MSERAALEWTRLMRRGDFARAWATSDRVLGEPREREHERPRHQQRVWDGTPLEGRRVLVHCYHGLGDTLQFARYLPRAAALAGELTVWAQPALVPLLRTLPGHFRLLPLHGGAPGVERDVDVEIMELAHVFRSELSTLPAEVPYLHVAPAPRPAPADTLAVGLVWAAGEWDARRSLPPELLRPLARMPGVELFLLQRGDALARRPVGLGTPAGSDDALVAARLMRALDLVITVDSMPAHLAGALGVRVWTLLHADADWRWLEQRDDSPWYPSMRLFRQPHPGAWEPVVRRVREELSMLRDELQRAQRW